MSTVVLLGAGAWAAHFHGDHSLSFPWRGTSFGVPLQWVCDAIALWFCIVTFLYTVGFVPWGAKASLWHFGLCVAGLGLASLGYAVMGLEMQQPDATGRDLSVATQTMLSGFILGPVLFLAAQVWFVCNLSRLFLPGRHGNG